MSLDQSAQGFPDSADRWVVRASLAYECEQQPFLAGQGTYLDVGTASRPDKVRQEGRSVAMGHERYVREQVVVLVADVRFESG